MYKRYDELVSTSETLDNLRVRVDRHEAELAELQRQGELGSTPSPPSNQQAENYGFSISIYSGERSSLSRPLELFYTRALSYQSKDALNYSRPILMRQGKIS